MQPETNGKDGDTTAKSEAEANVYGDKTSEAKVNGDKTSEDLTFSSKIELDQEGLTLAVEKRVAQDPVKPDDDDIDRHRKKIFPLWNVKVKTFIFKDKSGKERGIRRQMDQ